MCATTRFPGPIPPIPLECVFINVPLHNIYLSSDLVTGLVAVGIGPSLPFKGVHLLLGNDMAGDMVVLDPFLTSSPCVDQLPDPIDQEILDLYPPCRSRLRQLLEHLLIFFTFAGLPRSIQSDQDSNFM